MGDYSLLDPLRSTRQPALDTLETREEILKRMMAPFAILGLVAISIGAFHAFKAGQWYYSLCYGVFYLFFLVFTVIWKGLSFRFRSTVLLSSLFMVSSAVIMRLGLSGVGVLLMVLATGMTSLLWGNRAGLRSLALGALIICVVGVLIVTGVFHVPPKRLLTSFSIWQWITVSIVFVMVSGALIRSFWTLGGRLERSLEAAKEHTRILAEANEALTDEVARRKEAEESLRASEQRYLNLFEGAAVSLLEEDLSDVYETIGEFRKSDRESLHAHVKEHPDLLGTLISKIKLLDANETAVRMYRAKDKNELLGSVEKILISESFSSYRIPLDAFFEGSRYFECEMVNGALDGGKLDVLIKATLPERGNGKQTAVVSVLDLTEQKRLSAELLQARKMEAIGTLAGGIAHDFNNLLMGIQGCVSVLLLDTASGHPNRETLLTMEQLVRSGAQLTGQLLGVARRGRYNIQPSCLNELIEKSIMVFSRARKDIQIHTDLSLDPWLVEVDPGQMEQAFLNLMVNAGQAMPAGGDLWISTSNLSTEDPKKPDGPPIRFVTARITDSGTGMDEETKQRIFEPYFTTKEMGRGTGLGLASVLGIVQNHDGSIHVESQLGRGTSFTIRLPASDKRMEKTINAPQTVAQGSETVLLVEDEKVVLDVGARLLYRMGYKVLRAANGQEALSLFESMKDEIDLVILDMIMPGMGGGQVFERMKALKPDVKVLLSSGYSSEGIASTILEKGCKGFIQKPFTLTELGQKVREVLDSPSSSRPGKDER